VEQAIDRALKLIPDFNGRNKKCFETDPSTTVHFLAKALDESKYDPNGRVRLGKRCRPF